MTTEKENTALTKAKLQTKTIQDLAFQVLILLEQHELTVGMAKRVLVKAAETLDKSKMQAIKPTRDRYAIYLDQENFT